MVTKANPFERPLIRSVIRLTSVTEPQPAILFRTGDATSPIGDGAKVIVHVCNDGVVWGAGFVMALSKRWREPEERYRTWASGKESMPFELGRVQMVRIAPDIEVANLIGQTGIHKRNGIPPIRYDAIERGLLDIASHCRQHSASVHMPRIGCGLAGGQWEKVEPLIREQLVAKGIAVTVYDLA